MSTHSQSHDEGTQHRHPLENQLRGSWNVMTGHAQMRAGAQWDDPELFFNGVISALQGRLQQAVGDHQARMASDALRTEWSGFNQETKGKIVAQWGKWTDNPEMLANGVVDLMQGKLDRYAGAAARRTGTPVADRAITLSDQAADNVRQALKTYFSENAK